MRGPPEASAAPARPGWRWRASWRSCSTTRSSTRRSTVGTPTQGSGHPPARDSEQDRLLELRAGSGLVVGLPFRRRAGLGVVIVRELDRALLAGLTLPQLPLPAAPLAADVLVELAQELRILIG